MLDGGITPRQSRPRKPARPCKVQHDRVGATKARREELSWCISEHARHESKASDGESAFEVSFKTSSAFPPPRKHRSSWPYAVIDILRAVKSCKSLLYG